MDAPPNDNAGDDGPDYDKRLRHLRAILYSIETPIRTVVKWTGRETVSEYQYVWQVLDERPGKRSEKVLDDLENALREKGYWVPYDELGPAQEVE